MRTNIFFQLFAASAFDADAASLTMASRREPPPRRHDFDFDNTPSPTIPITAERRDEYRFCRCRQITLNR